MEEITELIRLVLDQDMEGLYNLEKQVIEKVLTLNKTLKSLCITLEILEECELQEYEEFDLISDKYADYKKKFQVNTEFLNKVQKAIAMLEEQLK